MRGLVLGLALLLAGCTNPTSAYLNASEGPDTDVRRLVVKVQEHLEPQPSPMDWVQFDKTLVKEAEQLVNARKMFSQGGPPQTAELRAAALKLIDAIDAPLEGLHAACRVGAVTHQAQLAPDAVKALKPEVEAAVAALAEYKAAREKLQQ